MGRIPFTFKSYSEALLESHEIEKNVQKLKCNLVRLQKEMEALKDYKAYLDWKIVHGHFGNKE